MTRWSDEQLDELRLHGDPLADDVVADLYANSETGEVNRLLGRMIHELDPVPEALPACVRTYLQATQDALESVDEARLECGQRLFAQHGPTMSMILATYSLPAAYCAAKGVEVLWRTGKLYTNPLRRVFETAQLVIDVMTPGGLQPKGAGERSVQRVRLMHAGVRHLITHDDRMPWDGARLGVPINQEDMAGTLGTFAYIVLDGLDKLHIPLTGEERDSYLYAWDVVAGLMGLRAELRPQGFEEARTLNDLIHRRQIRPSQAGREMIAAIIGMMKDQTPGHLVDGFGPSMVRHFIADDPLCDGMGVPPADWTGALMDDVDKVLHWLGVEERHHPALAWGAQRLGIALLQALLVVDRGGARPSFAIPRGLADGWGVGARK